MADNFTDDITEKLIQYMDHELPEDEQPAIEKMLNENAELNERYQLLIAAKQAIRSQGLKLRVQALQNEYLQNTQSTNVHGAKIINPSSFLKNFMRVAAVFFVAFASYGVYQYTSTSNQSVFDNNFTSYTLPVNRSAADVAVMDSLYKAANYAEAIKAFDATPQKDQQDYFLAGQCYLHLNNANEAIKDFEQIKKLNDQSTQKYFADETDYYLALAYIKAGKIDKAKTQLAAIIANKQHMFYKQAKNISGLKLQILEWKEK